MMPDTLEAPMSATDTTPTVTVGDLRVAEGQPNYLLVTKEGVLMVGAPCWPLPGTRLGGIPHDIVPASLQEWLEDNLEEVADLLGGDEDNFDAVEAFGARLTDALDQGDIARFWEAGDWLQGDWAAAEEAAGRFSDLEDWASREASDARASGIMVDEADLVKTMTDRLTRKLADLGDAALVEWMPESLRESHTAAGNSGTYPHNGAERFVADRDYWQDLADDEEEGQWVRIVRDATVEDLRVYGAR